VGALCIIDDKPRHVSQSDLDLLRDLAAWVEKELTLDRELLQAGEMQRRLLPRRSPDLAGYEVAGRGLPARDVGGDFFDWYLAGPDLQLVLADVMGKGLGAAILAASVRAVIRGASRFNPLREAVSRAAYSLEPDLAETATFVTLFCARLAGDTGELEFIDAGHGLSLVLGQDGSSRRLHTGDLPLGVLPEQPWRLGRTTLRPGDTLVAVSDGFLDFFDDTSTALARLTALCRDSGSAQEMVDRMSDLARQQVPTDDITVVVVRRRDDTAG
jgi:serine phosphatase RsbU (regulator of sigma subunit)